jgi:hypothetical protein
LEIGAGEELFFTSSFFALATDFFETYDATIFSGSSSLSSSIFLIFREALGLETDLAGELEALFLAGEAFLLSSFFEILTSLISGVIYSMLRFLETEF